MRGAIADVLNLQLLPKGEREREEHIGKTLRGGVGWKVRGTVKWTQSLRISHLSSGMRLK